MKLFGLVVLALVGCVLAAPSSKIEDRLSNTLATKGSANVLVSMRQKTAQVLSKLKNAKFANRDERVTTVAHSLMDFAKGTQKNVMAVIEAEPTKVDFEVFWITNQVYIRQANRDLVEKIAALDDVADITEEFEVKLDEPIFCENNERQGVLAEWGVENIQAPEAWALEGGNNGTGAVVAGIDTGVLATHVDLAPNFRGTNYGWRDVTLLGTETPRDDNGHGTHTVGTIVGQNGIGVAPGAQWIACKALNAAGSGTNAGLISCGQWVACPTLPDGTQPDCTMAPDVVSNSWGGGQANPFYNEVIEAWHAAHIIPVFANGNSGPDCSTANSPADSLSGVFGVGATDVSNALASFSSKGPTLGGRLKPDISAPGVEVRSAWNTGDSDYNTISGTSMAAPHVAGVVTLLKAHNRDITFAQSGSILYRTCFTDIIPTGQNCGDLDENSFPNHAFGHGIVNALNALADAIGSS